MIENFPWWVGEKAGLICLSVYIYICMYAYSSNSAPGSRTGDAIRTGKHFFDAPERRKDDGANCGLISCTWHVPRAIMQTLAKNLKSRVQAKPMDGFGPTFVGKEPS